MRPACRGPHDGVMANGKRWRWWYVVLSVVAGTLVLVLVLVGMVAVSLAGGLDDLFAGEAPQEGDPAVVEARERAASALDPQAAGVAATATAGLPAGSLGRGEVHAPCVVGQHNWKIDDPFDLWCSLSRLEVLALPDRTAFREEMVALDRALVAEGWVPDTFGMDRVLTDYWDSMASPSSGGRRGYSMDDLPGAQYQRSTAGARQQLGVSWVEAGSTPDSITYVPEHAELRLADGGSTDPDGVVAAIPVDGYAVMITLTQTYFEA